MLPIDYLNNAIITYLYNVLFKTLFKYIIILQMYTLAHVFLLKLKKGLVKHKICF